MVYTGDIGLRMRTLMSRVNRSCPTFILRLCISHADSVFGVGVCNGVRSPGFGLMSDTRWVKTGKAADPALQKSELLQDGPDRRGQGSSERSGLI
jgi:hypothetical protein